MTLLLKPPPSLLLGNAYNSTGSPGPSVPCRSAELVSALAEIVDASVDDHGAAQDRVRASQADHGVCDVHLGHTFSVSSHVAQISHVAFSLGVSRTSVGAVAWVEVWPGGGAAVGAPM